MPGYVNFRWYDEETLHAISNVAKFLVYYRLLYHLILSRNCYWLGNSARDFLGVNLLALFAAAST